MTRQKNRAHTTGAQQSFNCVGIGELHPYIEGAAGHGSSHG